MSARATTPPLIQAPTAKEKKYDRQLRLWAANGQQALEDSHVLLVIPDRPEGGSCSSVAGIETLKNLILPGIGQFTIADPAKVTEADLGVSFFLGAESLGKSRAEEAKCLLEELNPDVKGHALSKVVSGSSPCFRAEPANQTYQSLSDLLNADPQMITDYSFIILCAPLLGSHYTNLCGYAEMYNIPVIQIQSSGFFSSFATQLPITFSIVDTHPDPDTIQDLRLLSPWPELSDQVKALGDIDALNDHDHGHIPYVLILLHHLDKWKAEHDNEYPNSFKEKTAFREQVRAAARTNNSEGGEENFDEAAASILKTIAPFTLGSSVRDMFDHMFCHRQEVVHGSANFWLIAYAVKCFFESDAHKGTLPLPGGIPDMKATSKDYVKLQNVYKAKARKDIAEVTATVRTLEKELERPFIIPDAEIEAFCKHAGHVKVLDGQSLPQRRMGYKNNDIWKEIRKQLEINPDDNMLPIMLAFEQNQIPQLKKLIADLVSDGDKYSVLKKVLAEVDRCAGAELHNISSLTAGMVAQEAIKIITQQYVPVDNVCVFDGIQGKTSVFKL